MPLVKVEVHLAYTASLQALNWNNHEANNQIKHKGDSQLANQLAIYNRGRGVELRV